LHKCKAPGDIETRVAKRGGFIELDGRHRVVEDEARAADQMPTVAIVDRAGIPEVVEETTRRQRAHAWSSMKAGTSHLCGMAANQPCRVTISAAQAAASRSGSLCGGPGWRGLALYRISTF